MTRMGRPRTRNLDLPPRMRMHHGAFWYVAGNPQTWTRLGTDRAAALLEWSRLEGAAAPAAVATVSAAITRYRRDLLPKLATQTQRDYGTILDRLDRVFGKLGLAAIRPQPSASTSTSGQAHPTRRTARWRCCRCCSAGRANGG